MTSPAPNPPRFRWLKRGLLLFVVAAVGLLVLRFAWGRHTQAKLDAIVADAQAQGRPIRFEDFPAPSVPNDENMAIPIRDALALMPVNAQGQTIGDTDWYLEGGAEYADEHGLPDPIPDNAAYLEQFRPVLDAMRQAAAMDRADWGLVPNRGVPVINLSFTGELRRLARHLEDAAWRAHALGDHALALEIVGHIFTAARGKLQTPCTVIDGLVAISVRALAVNLVERMLPQVPAAPGWRDALAALRDTILDESDLRHGMTEALYLGRWESYVAHTEILEGRVSMSSPAVFWNVPLGFKILDYSASRWALYPLFQADLADSVEIAGRNADAFAQSGSLGEAYAYQGITRQGEVRREGSSEVLQPFSHSFMAEGIIARTYYRHLTLSRLAGAAVAIKLYEIDHGRRPDTLAQLVPNYLDAIPRDPSGDGQTQIRYRPQGAQLTDDLDDFFGPVTLLASPGPAILYSVGGDGDDDGGLIGIYAYDGRINDRSRYETENGDMWFLLDPEPDPYPITGSGGSGSLGPGR